MNAVEILAMGSGPKRAASAEVGVRGKDDASFRGEIESLGRGEADAPAERTNAPRSLGRDTKQDLDQADLKGGELSKEGQDAESLELLGMAQMDQPKPETSLVSVQGETQISPTRHGLQSEPAVARTDGFGRAGETGELMLPTSQMQGGGGSGLAAPGNASDGSSPARADEPTSGRFELSLSDGGSKGEQASEKGEQNGREKGRAPQPLFLEDAARQRAEPGLRDQVIGKSPLGGEVQKLLAMRQSDSDGLPDAAIARRSDKSFEDNLGRTISAELPVSRISAKPDMLQSLVAKSAMQLSTDGSAASLTQTASANIDSTGFGLNERMALPTSSAVLPSSGQLQAGQGFNTSQIIQAISVHLDTAPKPGEAGHLELRLEPEELGKLRITFTPRETGFLVSLTAERSETLDLIRRHSEALLEDLERSDFGGAELAFDMQQGDQEWEGAEEASHMMELDSKPVSERAVLLPEHVVRGGDDRLDIRL